MRLERSCQQNLQKRREKYANKKSRREVCEIISTNAETRNKNKRSVSSENDRPHVRGLPYSGTCEKDDGSCIAFDPIESENAAMHPRKTLVVNSVRARLQTLREREREKKRE